MELYRTYFFRIKSVISVLAGIAIIVQASGAGLPDRSELSEVRGILVQYEVVSSGSGSKYVMLILRDGRRFWTEAVTEYEAPTLFRKLPARVAVYVNKDRPRSAKDIKSYGLIVDGKEIVSLDAALRREKTLVRYALPLIGILLILLGVIMFALY